MARSMPRMNPLALSVSAMAAFSIARHPRSLAGMRLGRPTRRVLWATDVIGASAIAKRMAGSTTGVALHMLVLAPSRTVGSEGRCCSHVAPP